MKTLTFTVEDALLSPIGFSVLSGAGLLQGEYGGTGHDVHVHRTTQTTCTSETEIDLSDALATEEQICKTAPIFVAVAEDDGSVTGEIIDNLTVDEDGKKLTNGASLTPGKTVFVDYYVTKKSSVVDEIQIDAENFAGYYYVEASTLFRDQATGRDLPAEITFPSVKIQSNFTFTMASSGDPSTFTFTMDAFPGYTYFNKTKKVLCAMQIVDDIKSSIEAEDNSSVFPHDTDEKSIGFGEEGADEDSVEGES